MYNKNLIYRWPIPNFLSLEYVGISVGIVRKEREPSSVVVNSGDSQPLAKVAADTFLRGTKKVILKVWFDLAKHL